MILSITTPCIEWHYAECRYAECRGASDWYCHDSLLLQRRAGKVLKVSCSVFSTEQK
jgi:hypothetical protein